MGTSSIYYHYATWSGSLIAETQLILPSHNFARYEYEKTPSLTFLTKNDYWEPSVQATDPSGHFEKAPSDPVSYTERGIPCWRFRVPIRGHTPKLLYHHPMFLRMLEDAKELGSDLSQWHWTPDNLIPSECSFFSKGEWVDSSTVHIKGKMHENLK